MNTKICNCCNIARSLYYFNKENKIMDECVFCRIKRYEQLYEEYGKLLIQLEIIQGKIQEVKRQIAQEMNKPKEEKKWMGRIGNI